MHRSVLRLAFALATLAVIVGVPVAGAADGNRLLASGTVSELSGRWVINFDIHTRGNGGSSTVAVTTPNETFSYDTSVCRGSYGGTTVYGAGRTLLYVGDGSFQAEYYGYEVREGGPYGADYSWVVPVGNLAGAQALCANPQAYAPAFAVSGGSEVHFNL